jgi:hypothetical protein
LFCETKIAFVVEEQWFSAFVSILGVYHRTGTDLALDLVLLLYGRKPLDVMIL